MSDTVSSIILLIGLAVGVDYTMFYLKREREERARGRSAEEALEVAAATSGRSVLISGCTVLVAMAGMVFTGDADYASFGVATMTVVAVAMLGSLTVLPALLSKLGDNVDRLRVPFVHRLRRDDGEGRFWGAIIDRVLRHPALSAGLAAGVLLLLAVPACQLHTANPSIDTYPQNLLQTYNRMKTAFPGTQVAAERRRQGAERGGARGQGGDRPAPVARSVHVPHVRADRHRRERGEDRRHHLDPDEGKRHGLDVEQGPRGAPGRDRPADGRQPPRRRGRRDRRDRPVQGLQRPDEDRGAARLRIRPAVRVRADARVVPLARDRRQDDRPQPALDRRGLRDPRPRLPARLGQAAPGLRVHRRDRPLPADPAVRDPLRAVDGLPRLRPQPCQRGLRERNDDRRGSQARHQVDCRRRDERGDRHGRRVRHLRDAADDDLQAVRRRPGLGDPDRRDADPGDPPAGVA